MDPAAAAAAGGGAGPKSDAAPSAPALHGLPVEMTTGEMEAAIAALPAKKEALREAFDVLAACSPFPLPFAWGDLDSYISSLQSSIDRRFGQLRVLEAARPALAGPAAASTSDGEKGGKQEEDSDEEEKEEEEEEVEEEEVEEEEEIEEEEVEEEIEEEEEEIEEEEEEVREEVQEAGEEVDEEQQGANEEMQKSKEDADESSKSAIPVQKQEEDEAEKEIIEAKDEEQHGDKLASQEHDIGENGDVDAQGVQQVADGETMEAKLEEQNEAKVTSMEHDIEEGDEKASREQGNRALPSCSDHLRGVCAGMDVRGLLKLVCKNQSICLWHEYPVVMRHAPDAAALVLQVVQGFLLSKKMKTTKVWGNCVGLIRCLPAVNASLSSDTMKKAKQLAKDWKEMIDSTGSSRDVLNLSSWGLLYFLISYNIVSEFSVDEIFCIFGTLSRKQQKKNCIELCKGLGLVNRITDLIDYLIGNGQQLEALLLTQAFNLIDKYTPLSLLKGYVERAKQNALDIINMNSPRKSLSQLITKEVDSLMVAQNIVQQQITDFNVRSGMLAEMKKLLDQYATKRSSGDACSASTSNSEQQQQQQQKHTNKKRKREQLEQQQHRGQEIQQQKQQIKPQGKKGQQQTKPEQKKQQQLNTNKPQEQQQQQQQKQQIKPQEKMGKEQTKPEEQQQQQKTNRPQEQQHKKPQKKQQQQQQQQQSKPQEKRPRPCATKLPTPSIPASISPMVPHIVQVDSVGHSPYAAMPISHTYAAQLGWPGNQSAAFAQNVGVSQFMGMFNPQQPNYPFYRHPPFYPR
uniref:FRIGIDA-like protein n=1 Tax=Oryza nivara TaxID=4536 RepID=A0A0E0GQ73_ORYNI